MDKHQAHRHPALLHRAASVWLTDGKGKVLLQQRSHHKIVGAQWWGNTVCGNVQPNETAKQCAHRRLKQELGIDGVVISSLYPFMYSAYCNEQYGEHEHDTVFVGNFQGEVAQNSREVSETAWVSFAQLVSQVKKYQYPKADTTLTLNFSDLKKRTRSLEITINGRAALLSPWTVLMLRDSKLQKQFA